MCACVHGCAFLHVRVRACVCVTFLAMCLVGAGQKKVFSRKADMRLELCSHACDEWVEVNRHTDTTQMDEGVAPKLKPNDPVDPLIQYQQNLEEYPRPYAVPREQRLWEQYILSTETVGTVYTIH